jgi:hypothetical protein
MINIDNNSYSGKNIVITNGKVFIDGMDVTPDSKNIEIKIEGNIDELKVDSCNSISVLGSVKNINTLSGDVDVVGHVDGNLKTMSGNIKCNDVKGSISTMSGNIKHTKCDHILNEPLAAQGIYKCAKCGESMNIK